MKKSMSFVLFFALLTITQAQFTSVQNGKWWYPSTWSTDPNASAIPDSTDDVTISHDINIDASGRCRNLTLNADGHIHNGAVTVYGSLLNYGIINGRGEWNGMKITLRGDLTNYGSYDSDTDFNGASDQYLVSADTLVLGNASDYNPASKIIISGSIIIKESWIFLRKSTLEFSDTLKIVNSSLNGGTINGNNNVFLGNQAIFGWGGIESFGPEFTTLKNMKLEGNNYFAGSGEGRYGISIGEGVVNNGSLNTAWIHTGGSTQIFVDSDFENNGKITDQQDGLTIICRSGNIEHSGSEWSNKETKLNGLTNQNIIMPGDSVITGKVVFDAMMTGTNYQWQKDGVNIPNADAQTLSFTSGLSSSEYGLYQCIVDGNSSREIFVGNTLPDPFEIHTVTIKNIDSTSTLITWKTTVPATGFIFYAENDNSSGYPMEAMEPTGFRLNHSLILDNLTTGSTYYFIIDQNDDQWNNVRSEEYVFAAGDLTLGALAINSITDVPNDQGGWVHVNFTADVLDAAGDIKLYGVWEFSGSEWVSVGSVPATQDSAYTFLAHTYADSNDSGIHWSEFYITAHSTNPLVFYQSSPDSGYSIDNIAPAPPSGLSAVPAQGGRKVTLTWNGNSEFDFAYYKIYRNDQEYATTTDTVFVDDEAPEGSYSYKLVAFDANGNSSGFSETVDVLVGVEDEESLPAEFSLNQNYPNPFNPSTKIKYSIPAIVPGDALLQQNVTLKIYDALGKEAATLVNERQAPGNYEVNFNASQFASGIYLYRITVGKFTEVRKMILMK